ncbi:MAG: peroxiredoxin family protein [Gammaproteobacteria bacterium]|nr:peroxiredoxin family protein [Gammaproteobacteria bacterium]
MSTTVAIIIGIALLLTAMGGWRFRKQGRPVPESLQQGERLPDFHAVDEHGGPLRSAELLGTPSVILFVRGNWCPFCTRQVKNLSEHYKRIVDLGARLILVTPKPLETTRRVAEFYEVEFEFWLDEDLTVARQLGLLHGEGVPGPHRKEYGPDTVWPTAVVVDANGIIRFTKLSKHIVDRPNPETLLQELRAILNG